MAIVDFAQDLIPFLELGVDDDFANVDRVHLSVEQFVKSYCGRSFESADFKQEFNHNDTSSIFLREIPVTKITKLALGTDEALRIYNTNADTSAVVNVDTTKVVLTYNGTDATETLTFAANTTMTAMATAINAVTSVSGWVAEAISNFGSYQSSELLPRYGAEAINTTNVYLKVPAQALSNFELDPESGEITRLAGFLASPRRGQGYGMDYDYANRFIANSYYDSYYIATKIYVNYTGGYTEALMPKDLKLAVMKLVKFAYTKIEEESEGLTSYTVGDLSKDIEMLPSDAMLILNSYKSWEV